MQNPVVDFLSKNSTIRKLDIRTLVKECKMPEQTAGQFLKELERDNLGTYKRARKGNADYVVLSVTADSLARKLEDPKAVPVKLPERMRALRSDAGIKRAGASAEDKVRPAIKPINDSPQMVLTVAANGSVHIDISSKCKTTALLSALLRSMNEST